MTVARRTDARLWPRRRPGYPPRRKPGRTRLAHARRQNLTQLPAAVNPAVTMSARR